MNKLSVDEKVRVVACLVEGNSLRATTRMTGTHRSAIQKLLVELGAACSAYQDKVFRNLKCKRIQCDEIWSFIGCKEKNVTPENKDNGWGDIWTWTSMCADTKLVPCWYVGTRDGGAAYHFIHDLAGRLAHRVQLTTDFKRRLRTMKRRLPCTICITTLAGFIKPCASRQRWKRGFLTMFGRLKKLLRCSIDRLWFSRTVNERHINANKIDSSVKPRPG